MWYLPKEGPSMNLETGQREPVEALKGLRRLNWNNILKAYLFNVANR